MLSIFKKDFSNLFKKMSNFVGIKTRTEKNIQSNILD
jgi:hypothetical protein